MEITNENKGTIVWDCGSPLYDSYELAELMNIIERHVTMSLPVSPARFERYGGDSNIKDDSVIERRRYDLKPKSTYRKRFHSFCARMGLMKKRD
ncbi:hypothetical protein F511_07370 [Dorcoceras hygrometricum]|uniref:Uncharacterized protein n=1 Tax=Dorcoceras hygrometricum TaxID=472368 RepID=A0A2Z7BDL9_9LAMI|nr:hypothetical protein F511_07370 [Dorcoceras hygrometricum]